VSRLEAHFHKTPGYAHRINPQKHLFEAVLERQSPHRVFYPQTMGDTGPFPGLTGDPADLDQFASFEEAYHKLMVDLTYLQQTSIGLLCDINLPGRLYVSGGFVQSKVFMEALSAFLPGWKIFIAENKRASALGAAVALHRAWQQSPLDGSLSALIPFKSSVKIPVDQYHSYFEWQSHHL
jgi:sugar (pentulose or hexulose) kinase